MVRWQWYGLDNRRTKKRHIREGYINEDSKMLMKHKNARLSKISVFRRSFAYNRS